MRKNLKQDKAITLIALVITIIVLLILAGVAISMLSGENGILNQAARAKTETERKSMQENIQLAVLSAMSSTNYDLTLENLTAEVKKQLGNDVEIEQDGIGGYVIGKNKDENGHLTDVYGVVDKEGRVGDGKWHFVKLTEAEKTADTKGDIIISDGVTTLIIGEKIGYNATKDEDGKTVEKVYTSTSEKNGNSKNYLYRTSKYTKGWGILGVEDGKVLIAPMDSILGKETTGAEDSTDTGEDNSKLYLKGKEGYENGISELNEISKIYGYGKGAEVARSITVEDINKITGYDPNYEGQNVNKTEQKDLTLKKAYNGQLNEYGNQVKYYWNGTDKPAYEGSNGKTGNLTKEHNSFNWYSGGEQKSNKPLSTDTNSKQYITTLASTYYRYCPHTLANVNSDTDVKGISKESKAYKMLFEVTTTDDKDGDFWLGSSFVNTRPDCATFGLYFVDTFGVLGFTLINSAGISEYDNQRAGIRPVICLRSDVKLIKSEDQSEWEIQ